MTSLVPNLGFDQGVVVLRVKGHGQVSRQRPRGRRPDDDRRALGEVRRLSAPDVREGRIHRRRGVVLVLHFGLGQRRQVVRAPVHGLEAPVDGAGPQELFEFPDRGGLEAVIHGEVGRVPRSVGPQSLELLTLDLDVFLRKRPAPPAFVRRGDALLFLAELEIDLVFDGQPVTVPAGDVGGVQPFHGLDPNDEILEHLVQRGSHVNVAVGVWGAVVQDEFFRPPAAPRAAFRRRSGPSSAEAAWAH